jgi:DNA-binding beta-propeller fold protein YncE
MTSTHLDSTECTYVAEPGWEKLPAGWSFVETAGVAVDSRDRVHVFNRGEHPVIVFDSAGNFLNAWGEGVFTRPHGITIGPDDSVYCTDDMGHNVRKFTPDGTLLWTLGTPGQPSDTGATSIDYRTILHSAGPFHYPTNVALGPDGCLFIADGYGNARVHKFAADGHHLLSWGEPGDGPGQFHVPHGIAVDEAAQRLIVADRENSRLQFFDFEGNFLHEWPGLARPSQVVIGPDGSLFVAELGYKAGMWPGTTAPSHDATGGRISIFRGDGTLLQRWGGGLDPCAAGDFYAPHDLCLDGQGSLYVGEVTWSAGGNRGLVAADCHSFQKFILRRNT